MPRQSQGFEGSSMQIMHARHTVYGALAYSDPILRRAINGIVVVTDACSMGVLLVDEDGIPLPRPLITVTTDTKTGVKVTAEKFK